MGTMGQNLAAWRKTHGYSQSQLARELGVVKDTVSKWERGEYAPNWKIIVLALHGLEKENGNGV